MLAVKERQKILIFLRYFSAINLFPIQVDVKGWSILPGYGKAPKAWACKICCAIFAGHAMYKALSSIHVFLFSPAGIPLHQMVIHGEIAAVSGTFIHWYYVIYVECADEFATFLKMTLTGNTGGGVSLKKMENDG